MMLIVLFSFLIYAIIHSLLAGKNAKAAIRHRLDDRAYYGLYRLGYNIFALLTVAPILWLMKQFPGGTIWSIPNDWQPILLFIRGIGLIGFSLSLLQIDLGRFSGLRQFYAYMSGKSLPLPDEPLQTGGVFALVRHPLYLFSLMLTWPMATMSAAYFGFALSITLYFMIGSRLEEKRLLMGFGASYAAYQQRVPWLIPVPRIRRRVPNKT